MEAIKRDEELASMVSNFEIEIPVIREVKIRPGLSICVDSFGVPFPCFPDFTVLDVDIHAVGECQICNQASK